MPPIPAFHSLYNGGVTLPAKPYDTAEVVYRTVSPEGWISYRQNTYSPPFFSFSAVGFQPVWNSVPAIPFKMRNRHHWTNCRGGPACPPVLFPSQKDVILRRLIRL